MNYTRETRANWTDGEITGKREYIEFTEKNSKGEKIGMELRTAIPIKEWKKRGIKQKAYISVDVYASDENGCWGRYNPQHTPEHKINFEYLPEDTEINRLKVIADIYNLAFAK